MKNDEISIDPPSYVFLGNRPILKRSSGNARIGHL